MSDAPPKTLPRPLRPIVAPVLAGVPHAFATRSGGCSSGLFDSLNFGNPGDLAPAERDPPANIAENLHRLQEAIGAGGRRVLQVHQVHGADVYRHYAGSDPALASGVKADAIVTDDPSILLCIRTADCAPVLIASADGRIVAAVHAGWRGVIGEVALAAVEAMRSEFHAGPLCAAVGPCIGAAAFEVGPEVLAAFRARFERASGVWHERADGKGHVDLQRALRQQLEARGVTPVELRGGCTVAQPGLFFSHRRDQGRTGRMASVIGPRAGPGSQ